MEKTFQLHALWLSLANLNAFRQIDGLSFKYQYRAKRLLEKLLPEVRAYEEIRTKMIQQYAEMENGQPKVENGNLVFKDAEAKAQMEAEINPIAGEEVKIDFKPLRIEMSDFGEMKPPHEIMDMIEPLCEFIDEGEPEKPPVKLVN